MKLRALNSIKGLKPDDEYTLAGEEFELDDIQAQNLLDLKAVEEVVEEVVEEEIEELPLAAVRHSEEIDPDH